MISFVGLASVEVGLPAGPTGEPVPFGNPAPAGNDQFGRAVASFGADRVLIGAHLADTTASDGGAAYLFNINGNLLATFANPHASTTDYFGYALASVGDQQVLIGAYLEDGGVLDSGRAYLFDTNGVLVTTIANPKPAELDFFGFAVAGVGADHVLIGAFQADAGAKDAGTAYLFSKEGALLTTFVNPTPETGDSFGWSVAALTAELVVIAANQDNGATRHTGAAYVFRTDGTLVTTLVSPRPTREDLFGWAVAGVGGDRVLVGTPSDDTGAVNAGAAYLFNLEGRLLATFSNPRPRIGDGFGSSVCAVGVDRVLIGAPRSDITDRDAGAAFLFDLGGKLLRTIQNPESSGEDFFGISVAGMGRSQAIIGAHYGDVGGVNTGAAYLIDLGDE